MRTARALCASLLYLVAIALVVLAWAIEGDQENS
jgi:nitrogen fixation-related uncharacterized protein